MTTRLNILRHGTLEDAREHMDGDVPLDEYELRALVFNLADKVHAMERDWTLGHVMAQAAREGDFSDTSSQNPYANAPGQTTRRGYDANELRDALNEVIEEFGGNREVLLQFDDGKQSFTYGAHDVSFDDGFIVIHMGKRNL